MTLFILGYDITEPQRLTRIHRRMVQYATPIEYSVFILEGNANAARRCLESVLPLMHTATDDVRIYPLPARGLQRRLGRVALPEGIIWTGLPAAWR